VLINIHFSNFFVFASDKLLKAICFCTVHAFVSDLIQCTKVCEHDILQNNLWEFQQSYNLGGIMAKITFCSHRSGS